MRSLTFDRFVAPAGVRPQLWRLLVGLVLATTVYLVWIAAVVALVGWVGAARLDPGWLQRLARAATPRDMLALLATFGGMMLGPIIAVRLIHARTPGTLFGPTARVLRHFVVAAGVVGAVLGLSLLVWSIWFDAVPNLAPGAWLTALPLALLGVAVQTGAEEVVFRGYILQQLAARFRHPAIWAGVPALIFGAVHFDPVTSGANAWPVVASALLFGLLAADLTARTGSIGAAWGFHFANNAVALLVVATNGTLTGLALWVTPYRADDADELFWLIPIDIALMLVGWWIIRRLLSR